ncbi:MAG: endonuclease MutS2, partial [Clostridiaceae bacterium]|nr:endonuclease MutS2 [Clostridiaceae bacterium]
GVSSLLDLINIAHLLKSARRTLDYAPYSEESDNVICDMISRLTAIRGLEERIYRAVISEEEMADDASPKLFDIRRQIQSRQLAIKDKLNDIVRSSKYSKIIQEPVVTMRSDRYCIPVKIEHRSELPGIVHDTSSSGQTLFVEPAFVVEENNRIRELRVQENEEIQRILYEFSQEVAENSQILLSNLEILSYLDFTFAKARLANEMKAIKPQINDKGYINIINGRHPLIDKNVVVPISIHLGKDFNTLVITGPNTGGKTVTLKTVGLFTLMMQAGLMVPADEGSTLCVFENVFADIGDEQSIEQSLSTFSSHMKNIVEILNKCDDRSLVLFDELGAGTDPTEGSALAMAILECVHQLGARTIATTHYSELKIFAQTNKGYANASCEFDVVSLRPTYRLLIGVPGKSNAFAISKRIGLDDRIIERAKEFLTSEDIRFEDMLLSIETNRKIIEEDRYEIEKLKNEIKRLEREISKEKEEIIKTKNEILSKARYEAREILNRARITSDRLLEDIRKASKEIEKDSLRKAEDLRTSLVDLQNELEGSIEDSIVKDESEPPYNLREGDTVRILSLNNKGTVLSTPDKDGKVYVQVGIMKVYVPLEDLRLVEEKKEKEKSITRSNVSSKSLYIKAEVDVRGLTVDEATDIIDKHIDNALVANQKQFSIIHGKGTGALRRGIHKYLETNKNVKSWRLGVFGEGDTGVTVVTLN